MLNCELDNPYNEIMNGRGDTRIRGDKRRRGDKRKIKEKRRIEKGEKRVTISDRLRPSSNSYPEPEL